MINIPPAFLQVCHSLFNLMEEPLFRRALGDGDESVMLVSRLAREPDPSVFDRHTLQRRKRDFPLEAKLVYREDHDTRGREHGYIVSPRQVYNQSINRSVWSQVEKQTNMCNIVFVSEPPSIEVFHPHLSERVSARIRYEDSVGWDVSWLHMCV